jgi:hypothetical protein
MAPSALIAIDVFLLYTLLGPVVLFGVYVLFDRIGRDDGPSRETAQAQKDPAVWSGRDIDDFLDQT